MIAYLTGVSMVCCWPPTLQLPSGWLVVERLYIVPSPGPCLVFLESLPETAMLIKGVEFTTFDLSFPVATVGEVTPGDLSRLARICPNIQGE